MFECFLGVERSEKESSLGGAGVTLRVIGRRADVASVALPKMNAWNCVHSREVHHTARSLYINYFSDSSVFYDFGRQNPDIESRTSLVE